MIMPAFMQSEWFVKEPDNWYLKDDAPEEIRKEYEEWKAEEDQAAEEGIILN